MASKLTDTEANQIEQILSGMSEALDQLRGWLEGESPAQPLKLVSAAQELASPH
jgi:hypothetical protein